MRRAAVTLEADRIAALLRPVTLLAMDVDGVLTDGTLSLADDGREQKAFHVADGLGLTALGHAGIIIAWLSGRSSPAVVTRAADLKIAHVFQNSKDKGAVIRRLRQTLGLPQNALAFIGDDWNDLLAFEAAGVRIAVRNADALVRQAADFVTEREGGRGAVREVCDSILNAKGMTDDTLRQYLAILKENPSDGSTGQ